MANTSFRNNLSSIEDNLLNFAYMLTSNRDEAYELLRATNAIALEREDTFTEGTNFKGWAFSLMRNVFINNYEAVAIDDTRKQAKVAKTAINLAAAASDAPEGTFDAAMAGETIKALAPEHTRVIAMFMTGFNTREIATRLGLTHSVVRTRLVAAKSRLRKLLTA